MDCCLKLTKLCVTNPITKVAYAWHVLWQDCVGFRAPQSTVATSHLNVAHAPDGATATLSLSSAIPAGVVNLDRDGGDKRVVRVEEVPGKRWEQPGAAGTTVEVVTARSGDPSYATSTKYVGVAARAYEKMSGPGGPTPATIPPAFEGSAAFGYRAVARKATGDAHPALDPKVGHLRQLGPLQPPPPLPLVGTELRRRRREAREAEEAAASMDVAPPPLAEGEAMEDDN